MVETQSAVDQLQPGTVIDDFEILVEIGSGGISRVYRARQRSLGRDVALKVTGDRSGDTRTSAEGHVLAGLQHENIVSVFSEVVTDSCRLLAMPLVEGPSLAYFIAALHANGDAATRLSDADCRVLVRQLCREDRTVDRQSANCGQLDESTITATWSRRVSTTLVRAMRGRSDDLCSFACGVARQLALALQHTHEQGVVHGDLKPANVLFSVEAKPLLTDFNVSGRADRAVNRSDDATRALDDTRPGESTDSPVGGTLLYMAPEQLAAVCGYGNSEEIDGRADVYSLGLVLFELLTGKWPFPESGIGRDPLLAPRELYASRLSRSIEFPDSAVRISSSLKAILRRCLQPSPDQRYQSASDLAEDLKCVLTCRPLRWAERATLRRRATSLLSRHRSASLVGALLLGLIPATTFLPDGRTRFTSSRPEADATSSGAVPAQTEGERHILAAQWEQSGRQALIAQQHNRAVIDLQRAVALTPENAMAQHNLGIALFRTARFAEAKTAFDKALKLGARHGRVYSYRAATALALGDVAAARIDFEQARRVATDTERQEIEANYQTFLADTATRANARETGRGRGLRD